MPKVPGFRAAAALVLSAGLALAPAGASAQREKLTLIRDAEIEATLREMTGPIFEAAALDPQAVQIYLIKDERLNAFVAGGMNLFLNTGLIMRAADPAQLLGVVAHETGHIAGGHLSRVGGAQRRAAAEMILATVLGAAAAVAGAPGLGTAIISGGQSYAQSGLMRFSRSQEQAADQAALGYLERTNIPADGLLEMFRILENENMLAVSSASPYLQTHPLTRDRIRFVENHVANRPAAVVPEEWRQAHARTVAKLQAFLDDPREVLGSFQGREDLPARYARAIAHYRLAELELALAEIDGLISLHPDDPYFHELKGQMLFENGRIEAALEPYREAVRLAPGASLLRIALAQALIETGTPAANRDAIAHLEEAVQLEPTNAAAWRLLGIARGRAGQEGVSALALAEYALLTGKEDDARLYARRAENRIAPSDPAWLRLQDILRVIEEG